MYNLKKPLLVGSGYFSCHRSFLNLTSKGGILCEMFVITFEKHFTTSAAYFVGIKIS